MSVPIALGVLMAGCSGPVEPAGVTAPPVRTSETVPTTDGPGLAQTTVPVTTATVATLLVASDQTTVATLPVASDQTTVATLPVASDQTTAPSGDSTTTTLAALRSLAYREVTTAPFPVELVPLPGADLLLIASKDGRLWLYGDDGLHAEPFLDIRHRVRDRGEQGLLGLALAPDYQDTGRLFLHYTDNEGATVLSEYVAGDETVDPATGTVLLRIAQPAANHNGGTIAFGPDGYLYMGLGDGGGANDRFGHGQNDQTPLGALLRFDVSVPGVVASAPGNPFPAPEVWSIGLRNPWRFTIDHSSGLVVIADVGQDRFEEVSIAPVAAPGLNYGWPLTEGLHCFRPRSGCDAAGLTLPVLEVEHGDAGTCSITGGVVYRGAEIPELYGHYLFSDYCAGYLRSFPIDGSADQPLDWTDQVGVAGQVVAFGTDAAGEVYVMTAEGSVLRIVAERW